MELKHLVPVRDPPPPGHIGFFYDFRDTAREVASRAASRAILDGAFWLRLRLPWSPCIVAEAQRTAACLACTRGVG